MRVCWVTSSVQGRPGKMHKLATLFRASDFGKSISGHRCTVYREVC